jgi:hypothetical protein
MAREIGFWNREREQNPAPLSIPLFLGRLSAGHEAARYISPDRPGIGNEAVRDGIGA